MLKITILSTEYLTFDAHIILTVYKQTDKESVALMASKTRRFFLNALSLTVTALIMRGVGMIFNIYVSNKAGSEAMGLYSLLGSVYVFSITLATFGINLGTTKLVSDALGIGDSALARRCASKALICCTLTGSVTSFLLFTLAPVIGQNLLGDKRSVTSLRILALTLVPIAVCACLSGYFTAVRRVKANAAFQVVSQGVRIASTMALLSAFVGQGTEKACIALVIGSAISELLSLIITYSLYRYDIKKLDGTQNSSVRDGASITKKLFGITLPVTFSACIRSALMMVQNILIPKGLKSSGSSWQVALSSYGAVHGMALPFILFPSALLSAFAGLLIPEVSECCVKNDSERLKRVSFRALTLSLIFSLGVSGIMLFFSEDLGLLIYKSAETSKYIRVLAPLIPVMYVDSVCDAVLKGSGHQVYSMNVNIIDALTSCFLVFILVPQLGIWGYIIAIYATEILNTSLSVLKMISVSKFKPLLFHQIVMPLICIIGATNISKIIINIIPNMAVSAPSLVMNILLTLAIYVALLKITKTIGNEENEFFNAALLPESAYDRKFRSDVIT